MEAQVCSRTREARPRHTNTAKPMSRSILVVDDEPQVLRLLGRFLEREGWRVSLASDAEIAIDLLETERPDMAVLDLHLPGLTGLDLIRHMRRHDPDAVAIVLTGSADVPAAVEAMKAGAENFLTKPIELSHLDAAVERAYEKVQLRRRVQAGQDAAASEFGRSPLMRDLQNQFELVADSDASVLLLGETGTGKSWAARAIHERSPRSKAAFVEVNCAGLSPTFLESELFGHEKGAFTDAKVQKRGLFEIADGGTLFLDEVGDLSSDLQPKLLTAIESRRFRRLGGTREIASDIRLITATNRPLDVEVRAGRFREDLYYRISVMPIRLPPLRARGREDILHMIEAVMADLRRKLGRRPQRISADAKRALLAYTWPGNIRELRNVLERALILATRSNEITPSHLPVDVIEASGEVKALGNPRLSLEAMEKRHITRVLEYVRGNRAKAARLLGVSRGTLYQKMKRYDIEEIGVQEEG